MEQHVGPSDHEATGLARPITWGGAFIAGLSDPWQLIKTDARALVSCRKNGFNPGEKTITRTAQSKFFGVLAAAAKFCGGAVAQAQAALLNIRHNHSGLIRRWVSIATTVGIVALLISAIGVRAGATPMQTSTLERKVLAPALPEAPFDLRFFSDPVKTNSRGDIITGRDDDPVKKLVGAEAAGQRAGMDRFTKILFGVGCLDGRPDPGTRIFTTSSERRDKK